jgi:DNA-binding IscR family transcriptional regulator
MPNPFPTRQDDERLLLILALRKRGVPSAKVAEAAGVSRANIDNILSRIRLADLAESGEAASVVRRGYA